MGQQLVADELVEQAHKNTGLDRFDSESYREGLEVLVADLNAEDPADSYVDRNRKDIITALSTRLKVSDYLSRRPELLKRPIERPVFVFGVPRTGTTLLSNLLATDPARRSPLSWEIDDPVPPPTTATLFTDPRALTRLEEERKLFAEFPEAGKYYRMSAIYPNECVFFMMSDFKGLIWEARGKLPNYRDWLYQTDMTSAYQYHKRFLQLLQADAPGIWNLKLPSHSLWLETILNVYPDARFIWTHRDPLAATGSFCSLMSLSHFASTNNPHPEWLAQNYSWQCVEHANRIMAARERFGHDRIIDVHYADLMRQPITAMRALYKALGDEFTDEVEAGMQAWLDDNAQDKFGRHEYKLAQFGLEPEKVRGMFERYLSAYDVEREG
jgi:Sulfotransferase family